MCQYSYLIWFCFVLLWFIYGAPNCKYYISRNTSAFAQSQYMHDFGWILLLDSDSITVKVLWLVNYLQCIMIGWLWKLLLVKKPFIAYWLGNYECSEIGSLYSLCCDWVIEWSETVSLSLLHLIGLLLTLWDWCIIIMCCHWAIENHKISLSSFYSG